MADSLTLNIAAGFRWENLSGIDLSTFKDASQLDYSLRMESGVGSDQCDRLWCDRRSVAAGANDDIDLTALARTIFNVSNPVSLAKLKYLRIDNENTLAADVLRLDSSVANACTGPFGGSATSKLEIGAGNTFHTANTKSGWTVTNGSADVLRISNPGSNPISYVIFLAGSSS